MTDRDSRMSDERYLEWRLSHGIRIDKEWTIMKHYMNNGKLSFFHNCWSNQSMCQVREEDNKCHSIDCDKEVPKHLLLVREMLRKKNKLCLI